MVDVTPLPKQKASKRKPPTAAALKRKATKLWGEYVHLRDRVCQVCGKADGKLDAHHVMVRTFQATRADPANGVLVCYRDHQMLHSDPMTAVAFYTERFGAQGYFDLRNKAYSGVSQKYTASFWQAAIDELEELLEGVR
jgi:hypothetical protein